jgi:hypothetical protein
VAGVIGFILLCYFAVIGWQYSDIPDTFDDLVLERENLSSKKVVINQYSYRYDPSEKQFAYGIGAITNTSDYGVSGELKLHIYISDKPFDEKGGDRTYYLYQSRSFPPLSAGKSYQSLFSWHSLDKPIIAGYGYYVTLILVESTPEGRRILDKATFEKPMHVREIDWLLW